MLNLKSMLSLPYGYYDYIWVEVKLVHETKQAILIEFDGKKVWLPNAWIICMCYRKERSDKAISIKISQYNWAKKFS